MSTRALPHMLCFLPWDRNFMVLKHASSGHGWGLHPTGKPLASGSQELVHLLGRKFWSSFNRLFNISQRGWAPRGEISDQCAVHGNFPIIPSYSWYHFPRISYLYTGPYLRLCFLGEPVLKQNNTTLQNKAKQKSKRSSF